jgi:hypothetical protein
MPNRSHRGLAFLLSAQPAQQLFLPLGHFVYALLQAFEAITGPAGILLSPKYRGRPAKHCQGSARRHQT